MTSSGETPRREEAGDESQATAAPAASTRTGEPTPVVDAPITRPANPPPENDDPREVPTVKHWQRPDLPAQKATAAPEPAPLSRGSRPSRRLYARGSTIGRYIVLDTLGEGGMGAVYAAYDPELDRRVALKLLQTRASHDTRRRLEREARALGRLSHPNVVQVYDAGIHKGDVFIAMELVEGQSLKQWCRKDPRLPFREVLQAYLDAARGIAAAHDKGLIHRDIKPANVLLGNDGRVRVADFGLAAAQEHGPRGDGHDEHDEPPSDESTGPRTLVRRAPADSMPSAPSTLKGRLDDHLTQTGAFMGTPAYMAPEQYEGVGVGPAADLYSFCCALYEGLYGELPFFVEGEANGVDELRARKQRGEVSPPPPGAEVPAWLRRVLLKGLSPKPCDRYPSMSALIVALKDDPAARLRARLRVAGFVGVMAALAGLAAVGWTRHASQGQSCTDMDQLLIGTWDPAIKASVQEAFASTGLGYAQSTFERVSTVLDEYAATWVKMRAEACEEGRAKERTRREISTLEANCLERRRSQMRALTELFARGPDPELVPRAVQAVQALPPLAYCADAKALTAAIPPPEEPSTHARVEALQEQVDKLEALHEAGKYREGLQLGEGLLRQMADLDYAPLEARAMYWLSHHRLECGDDAGAEAMVRQTLLAAAKAQDDVLVARAWNMRLVLVGHNEGRHDEALHMEDTILVAVERSGDGIARVALFNNMGLVFEDMGRLEEARGRYERALALAEKERGPGHPDVGITIYNLGNLLLQMNRIEDAKTYLSRARAILETALGPDHPLVAYPLVGLGRALVRAGDAGAAAPALERALALQEKALGPDQPQLTEALLGLGELALLQGKPAQALPVLERALVLDKGMFRADVQLTLARALWDTGKDRARAFELIGKAQEHYHQIGHRGRLDEVAQWLAEHRSL